MTIIFEAAYTLPASDYPLTHARIAHARNWLAGGTATASGTATGFFADAPLNTLTYEAWRPDALPATWTYTHNVAAKCDYCCIAGHDMGTRGASLSVQYYDGSTWQAVIAATQIRDNSPIFCIFAPQTASQWRVSITGTTLPKISVIRFGKALQMQRPIFGGHSPITLARQTVLRSNKSETGEYLGRSKTRTFLQTGFSWSNLTTAWVRAWWPDLQRAVETEPFWIAWRPELSPGVAPGPSDWVIHDGFWVDAGRFWRDTEFWLDDPSSGTPATTAKNGDVGYCQVDAVPIPVNSGVRDLMAVEMAVRGLGHD